MALGLGVGTLLFEVADQSYLPFLVGKAHLVEGNAKLAMSHSAATFGGPALGGWLVQLLCIWSWRACTRVRRRLARLPSALPSSRDG